MVDWGDFIAYTIILVLGITIYLKKTNQTLPEFLKRIIDLFREVDETL